MRYVNPDHLFSGVVLVIAPHMDDEVLACGGTLASLSRKDLVFPVYATNGTRSPVQLRIRGDQQNLDLEDIRMEEARRAMSVLGIPDQNLHFLAFPDGELKQYMAGLRQSIGELIISLQPDQILVPFRYDRHPDHLALYQATIQAIRQSGVQVEVYEYFVYNRYRMLPGGDIRKFISPELLLSVDIREWSVVKKNALGCYASQTTRYYNWQERPILPSERVEQVSQQPEIFLRYDPEWEGASIFGKRKSWIRLTHFIEPQLKRWKELGLTWLHAGMMTNDRQPG
jgi:LmbE family N-acetylglucosaminyl deacetylase